MGLISLKYWMLSSDDEWLGFQSIRDDDFRIHTHGNWWYYDMEKEEELI